MLAAYARRVSGTSIVKVRALGADTAQRSNVRSPTEEAFATAGALTPPYDPATLCALYETSSALRPNVEAYATNIEAFGFTLEPTINLSGLDADKMIREAIMLDRLHEGELPIATPEEVSLQRIEIESTLSIERMFLRAWFSQCTDEISFVELRKRSRIDLEVSGNAYWECLRDHHGKLVAIEHVPSMSIRLMPRSTCEWIEVSRLVRISPMSLKRRTLKRRPRLFVQIINGVETTYFKEFGDQRVISSVTGRRYASLQELEERERGAPPATELIHFKVYSPASEYGVPRWVGATPAVVGTRQSEEINVLYFNDKCIPPLAVIVEGGVLADGAVQRIEETIRDKVRGRENFHSILLVESGAGSENTGGLLPTVQPKITIQPLAQFQQQDALFQTYESNNAEKVGQQFRLPRLLRGLMTDFNRATAESALQYAEQQVFQPEREVIDHTINRTLLCDLGVRLLTFRSSAPVVRDPPSLMAMIKDATQSNLVTLEEGRELLDGVFGREFAKLEQEWVKGPFSLLARPTSAAGEVARGLVEARAALDERERLGFSQQATGARDAENAEVIELGADDWKKLFRPTGS